MRLFFRGTGEQSRVAAPRAARGKPKTGRERLFASSSFPAKVDSTKNSPLRGRVRGFRGLLPRGRHGVNLACDAVCPMGLSTQSLERRRCSLLELGTKGTLGYLTCENSRRPGRRCARRVENRRSSGGRASKTPRDYWVYNRARRPDGSTARPRTGALERLRCVRGPGHADVRTLRGVLFTKYGRRRVTVGRRARDCE